MSTPAASLGSRAAAALTALGENTHLAAIRAGMVAIVPLTIVGGLFMIAAFLPVPGWEQRIAGWLPLLQVPVTATFGLLGLYACLAIAYGLGRRLGQDAIACAVMAGAMFLLLAVEPKDQTLVLDRLGSKGLFTAILIAIVTVHVRRFCHGRNLVIRLPAGVPPMVQESFLSLVPLGVLAVALWSLRFGLGIDLDHLVQSAFQPLVFALNTLPGILVYAFLVTLLWSVGVNGDNALDAVVAPIFLQFLAGNVEALARGQPPPYATANGFFTTFVNVGGTGATLALALLMLNSRDPGFRQVSRVSLPAQVFQINEPIFFGFPIVLNPILMVPYVLSALTLTAGTYALMAAGLIQKPIVNVPWTTPPIIGHYLVTGGDWRAAVWGVVSIGLAMAIYWPFARAAERARLRAAPPPQSRST